jgi:ribonuclease P protein component
VFTTVQKPIRDRATFARLRRPAGQARSGPVRVRHVGAASPFGSEWAIGYALGRKFGSAVRRNRARRRLHAAVDIVLNDVPPGNYLLSADSPVDDLDFCDLVEAVGDAMARAAAAAAFAAAAAPGPTGPVCGPAREAVSG